MPDRQKILHELDHQVADADWCDNDWKDNVPIWMLRGALVLLREQEAVKPKVEVDTWVCGNCGTPLERQSMVGENAVLSEQFDYCPSCGKPVKWE